MDLSDLKKKLPKLELGKGASKDGLKPPQFLSDLYWDLRDRRLLPLVAVLLVAIVAVPIVLSGKGEEEESSSIAPITSVGGSASKASFAVVPADTGLRDYHRRLGHRTELNPFRPPKAPKKAKQSSGSGGGSGSSSVGAGSSGSTSVETTTSEPPSSSGGSGNTTSSTNVVVQNQVVGYTIDVEAGYEELQEQNNLKPMTDLPSKKSPLVVFMGVSEDHKRALFLMTSSVTAYYGKAHCSLDKQACQLLEMKPGTTETFATGYGESEKRYKLVLDKINRVVTTNEAAATTTTKKKTVTEKPAEEGSGKGH